MFLYYPKFGIDVRREEDVMAKQEPKDENLFSPQSSNSSSSNSMTNNNSSNGHAVSSPPPISCNSLKFSIESLLIRKDPSEEVRQRRSSSPFNSPKHLTDQGDRNGSGGGGGGGHPFAGAQFLAAVADDMQHQQLLHPHHHQRFLNRSPPAGCLPISWQILSK